MQIIRKNLHQGNVVVKIDSLEDLWALSQVIDADDIVSGKTERKIKIGGQEGDRKQAVVKKTIFIELKVEKVEFHKHSDNLRISGVIIEGPEDVPRGSHHTFDVEQGTIITITKLEWPGYQLEKLDEATQKIKTKILMVLFDREEAIFAMLKNQGHELLSKLKGDVAKKGMDGEGKNFYIQIIELLKEYDKRYSPNNIVIASPSFWKEYLMKEMPAELKPKVTAATCSDVEEGAIKEVLQRPELRKVLESDRAAKELGQVEELLRAVSKEEACYGAAECKEKSSIGAVKELMVGYDFINRARQADKHREIEQVMRLAEKTGAKVSIIGTEEAEKKLGGLGGIAGILRWKQQN
ncbi:MAG: mRNA surveillance protein pelota [archaeon]